MIKVISITLSFVIFLSVIELIRQEKLTFKYAAGWLFVSVLAIGLSVFDRLLFDVAQWCGFELPSNFIFFTLLSVFIFLSLLMTVFLSQQQKRNDTIAQSLGILEQEVKSLKSIKQNKTEL
ncbi:MAG: DUF2304 domain-containing protein [Candidatus Omnitrophica bacterium]|nr:DUF2304 domain-containing protein [Candidatus Omnitrophota bacterium]